MARTPTSTCEMPAGNTSQLAQRRSQARRWTTPESWVSRTPHEDAADTHTLPADLAEKICTNR